MTESKSLADLIKIIKNYIKERNYKKALESVNEAFDIEPQNPEIMELFSYIHFSLGFNEIKIEEIFQLSQAILESNKKSPFAWKNIGNAYFFKKDYDHAINYYQEALKLAADPKIRASILSNIGNIFLIRDNNDEAIRYCEKALKQDESLEGVWLNYAIAYVNKSNYEKAIINFKKVLELNEKNFKANFLTGDSYHHSKNFDDALKYYEKALKLAINNNEKSNVWANIGLLNNDKLDFERAKESYEKAICFNKVNTIALNNLGLIYNNLGEIDKAIICFERAIKIEPNNDNFWNNLGESYNKLKQFDKAIEYCEKAIELNPDSDAAYANLGNSYGNMKEFGKAIEVSKKSIDLNPNSLTAYVNLGNIYLLKSEFDKAINYYNKVLEIEPSNFEANVNMGTAYYNINDITNAIKWYIKALEVDARGNNKATALYNLGILYLDIEDNQKAIENLEKCLEIHENNVEVINLLSMAYYNLENYNKAIEYCQKAIKIAPLYAPAWENLGLIHYFKGEYPEALDYYEKAIKINPLYPFVWINKAIAYEKIDNNNEALKCYIRALELAPESGVIHEYVGIYYLNHHSYDKAKVEFNMAKAFYYKADLKDKINKINLLERILGNILTLIDLINPIDELINNISESKSLVQLRDNCQKISDNLTLLIERYRILELTTEVLDILLSKENCFTYLSDTLFFKKFSPDILDTARQIYAKYNLNDFLYLVDIIENFTKFIHKYSSIEDITNDSENILLNSIKPIEILGNNLTNVISRNLGYENEIIKQPYQKEVVKISYIDIDNFKDKALTICLVQLDYEITNDFIPFYLKNKAEVKKKIIKALEFAENNNVDIICFPELSFDEEFINEVKKFDKMIIIAGSYYNEDNFNICPVIINGDIIPVCKIHPSPHFETEVIKGRKMNCGSEIIIFRTKDKTFSFIILICIDFLNEFFHFCLDDKKVNFIFVPSLNPEVTLFQKAADLICHAYHVDSGLANLVEKKDKYGGSCFVCFENKKILQSLIKSGYKPDDSIDFKIIEANLEELLILKINPKQLEHPSTPKSMPRIQIIGKHKYNGANWE